MGTPGLPHPGQTPGPRRVPELPFCAACDWPVPSAGPGEALIAVHAAAITFAELTWDLEWTTWDGADRTPVIPSHEMSGTVAGLGDGVAGLAAGDEVIGLVGRSWRAGTRSALCSSSSSRTSASWPGWRSWPARERCER